MRSVEVFWEIQDAFAEVRREESRRREMLKTSKDPCYKTLLLSQNIVVQPLESNVQIMERIVQILVSSVWLLTRVEVDRIIVYSVIIVSDLTIVEKIVGNYMGNQQIGNQESKVMDEDTRPQ